MQASGRKADRVTTIDMAEGPCRDLRDERRIPCRALHYWNRLCGTRRMPSLREFQLDPLPELAPHFYLIRAGADFIFESCGEVPASICVREPMGWPVAKALPPAIAPQIAGFCTSVAQYGRPMADSGNFLMGNRGNIYYRNILMPLHDGRGIVSHILGAFNYRQA